jgi:hypothetical protein
MSRASMSWLLRIAISCGLAASTQMYGQKLVFDQAWWNASNDAEHTGFVLGFFDCPSASKMVYGTSSDDYIAYVDKALAKVGHNSQNAVPAALRNAHQQMHSRPVLKGGEEYKEKHCWLDGEWWGDAKHGDPDDKLGYVEGFLACEFGSATVRQREQYVKVLNRHFAVEANEHDKIANILQPVLELEKQKS